MKAKITTLFIFLFSCMITDAQITFEKTYGGSNDDFGYSFAKTFDGGYVIGGNYNNVEPVIIKTNSQGDTLWMRTYSFLIASQYYYSHSIIQTSDSNYVLVGSSADSNSFVLKVNAIGDTLWMKTGSYGIYPIVYNKVTEDQLGNLIIAGSIEAHQPNNCCGPVITKLNSSGNQIWQRFLPCAYPVGCRIQEIYIDKFDGNYLVSGDMPYPTTPRARLTKVDTTGNVIWNQYYASLDGTVYSILSTPDSGFICSGINWNYDSLAIFKTDKNGNLQFIKKYAGPIHGAYFSFSIDTTINGGYFIAGARYLSLNNQDIFLMKIDSTYNLLWVRTFGGSLDEIFLMMKSTDDGGCAIIGSTQSNSAGGYDIYFIKTDSSGNVVGISETGKKESNISISPNPATNELRIKNTELKTESITIYDALGQEVYHAAFIIHHSEFSVDVSRWNAGIYFVRVKTEKETFAKKIVVSR
ncbi:MAG: T9SS type A sorting domain-containing protein [Bacteroidia bacterium]|nr:T9SS type A sorting domain-containing protein [Bacteroidia bacterium]